MADHLHGLCKNCLPQCREILLINKNEDECAKCNDAEPTVIVEEEGQTIGICTKCYLKELQSPRKSEMSKMKSSSIISKTHQQSILSNSPAQTSSYMTRMSKTEMLNKGFFSSEGKMLRRIEKYLTKFESSEALFKDLSKKTIIQAPIIWDRVAAKCDKVGTLMYIFVSKSHFFGCYHH
jgi:hypothetical protein